MIYLLSASLVLFLAWPACHLLLRYTNRYALNRWLLLIALGLVTLLPLLPVQSPAPEATVALQGTIDYVIADIAATTPSLPAETVQPVTGTTLPAATEAETTSIAGYFSWEQAYLVGLAFFLAIFAIRLAHLLTMHLRSRPNGDASYRLLHPSAKPGQAFSFGLNVYFSIDVPDSPDFDHILAHERIHARQGHSLDILLSEFFLCIFWFHPVAWWLRNKLRANLEYLVDAEVVNGGASRRDYQLALVRQSQIAHNLALALPFSEPSLKGRISRMTGLPQHRVVALLATLALLFWVGVAGIVVYGTANSGYTGKAPFVEYYADKVPDQILSFNIYGKRAPTVDEYYQLRAILQHIPQTQLYLYKNTYDEGLSLRLDHWLNVPAVLHGISPYTSTTTYFRLGLEPRLAPFSNPTKPRPTGGYFVPVWEQAINVPNGPDEATGPMTISSETWETSQRDLKYQDFADGEDFFVTINGRRFPLRPAETVPGPDGDEDLFLFDNGSVAPMTWTLGEYFAPYQQTATKRFDQLLGCTAEPDRGCPRSLMSIYNPSPEQAASWVAKNSPGKPFPIRAYYNDRPTTLEKLLSRQYGPNSMLQVGYRTDKVTSYVVQVIDDSPARIARIVREMNQVND